MSFPIFGVIVDQTPESRLAFATGQAPKEASLAAPDERSLVTDSRMVRVPSGIEGILLS